MRQDHFQIGKGRRHPVDMARMREVEIGETYRRGALMKEHRQPQLFRSLEDRERFRTQRIEI